MVTRREFLKTAAAGAGAVVLNYRRGLANPLASDYFALNGFIENHRDAVFVLITQVNAKTDAGAIRQVGHDLGNSLFVPTTVPAGAYSVAGPVAIKPNITSWSWDDPSPSPPFEAKMGIQTDVSFVEGIVESIVDLTVQPSDIHIREANYFASASDGAWYNALGQRTGIDLKEMPALPGLPGGDIHWTPVTGGVWYNQIPHLWPVNAPGSCLINIAKLKSHSMGMTLCSKNLQGTNARPYVAHCTAWNTQMSGVNGSHVVPGAFTTIKQQYDGHKAVIPRWRTLDGDAGSGSAGGLWMETHTARCLDNNSVLHPLLNIIEGVYGREGPFVRGPGSNGLGVDLMTNIVVFGKNALHVDIIGTYLAGHEPGNFGLFHIARERGLSAYLNPRDIPLYEWKTDGTASLTTLGSFPRAAIRTLYLPQAGEQQYHMVDQPYDYGTTYAADGRGRGHGPDAFVLEQNFPNPFNPTTSIQYTIPRSGNVRVEVFDAVGQLIDLLVDGPMPAGDHLVRWRCEARASGTYFCRILFDGMSKTRPMIVLK